MVGFPAKQRMTSRIPLTLCRVRFSNAFTFIYSPRKGTAAARMEQLPYAVKKDRITRLIALQNQITKELSEEYIGGTYEILVEDSPRQNQLCGRTESGKACDLRRARRYGRAICKCKSNKAQRHPRLKER